MNDITKHDWNDVRVKVIEAGFDFVTVTTTSHNKYFDINKDDAIEIAKHFNLISNKTKERKACSKCGTSENIYVEAAKSDIARGISTRSTFGNLQGLMQAGSAGLMKRND